MVQTFVWHWLLWNHGKSNKWMKNLCLESRISGSLLHPCLPSSGIQNCLAPKQNTSAFRRDRCTSSSSSGRVTFSACPSDFRKEAFLHVEKSELEVMTSVSLIPVEWFLLRWGWGKRDLRRQREVVWKQTFSKDSGSRGLLDLGSYVGGLSFMRLSRNHMLKRLPFGSMNHMKRAQVMVGIHSGYKCMLEHIWLMCHPIKFQTHAILHAE